jgi:hypothetical protein
MERGRLAAADSTELHAPAELYSPVLLLLAW